MLCALLGSNRGRLLCRQDFQMAMGRRSSLALLLDRHSHDRAHESLSQFADSGVSGRNGGEWAAMALNEEPAILPGL